MEQPATAKDKIAIPADDRENNDHSQLENNQEALPLLPLPNAEVEEVQSDSDVEQPVNPMHGTEVLGDVSNIHSEKETDVNMQENVELM